METFLVSYNSDEKTICLKHSTGRVFQCKDYSCRTATATTLCILQDTKYYVKLIFIASIFNLHITLGINSVLDVTNSKRHENQFSYLGYIVNFNYRTVTNVKLQDRNQLKEKKHFL